MLGDICANSEADLSFSGLNFAITGSDDAVKAALMVMSEIKFVAQSQYEIHVKIELASEHKEFVSGKKNGKINKIMGQSIIITQSIHTPVLMRRCRRCKHHVRRFQRV